MAINWRNEADNITDTTSLFEGSEEIWDTNLEDNSNVQYNSLSPYFAKIFYNESSKNLLKGNILRLTKVFPSWSKLLNKNKEYVILNCYSAVLSRIDMVFNLIQEDKDNLLFRHLPISHEKYQSLSKLCNSFDWMLDTEETHVMPKPNSPFIALASSSVRSPMWAKTLDKYRGQGVPGAIASVGLNFGEVSDNLWTGNIKIGAPIQFWRDEAVYQDVKLGKERSDLESQSQGVVGHAGIFYKYLYEKDQIVGFQYIDQWGLYYFDKLSQKTVRRDEREWTFQKQFVVNV